MRQPASSMDPHPRVPVQVGPHGEVGGSLKDAELFVPGSYRWDRFLTIANHKGRLCRQYVTGIPGSLDDGKRLRHKAGRN